MSFVTVNYILAGIWAVMVVFWVVSAFGVKRSVKAELPSTVSMMVRLSILIGGIALLSSGLLNPFFDRLAVYTNHSNPILHVIGTVMTAGGVAFAIWARVHLGRNWSSVPVLKEDHELVTSGPYSRVRHPIYSGVLLALLGSSLAGGYVYVLLFLLFLSLFIYRVFEEERLMMRQFPETYPEYRGKTKALIPFVW